MKSATHLGPSEIVSDRPFTDPKENAEDVAIFWGMVERLRLILSQADSFPDPSCPFFLNSKGMDGCRQRIIILNLPALQSHRKLTVIGFSGQKQPEADYSLLDGIDLELVEELCQYPGIVSYSSRKSVNGDWVNLVLFNDPKAIEHWSKSEKHKYAVRALAPDYYASIRLHRGTLPQGLKSGGEDLILHQTKYYDFQGGKIWRARRELNGRGYRPIGPARQCIDGVANVQVR